MPLLSRAPSDIAEFVGEVMDQYHPELTKFGVTVDVMMAHPNDREADGDIAPLKLHGYPCAAVVRIVPYKQRVKGQGDCEITLDAATWKRLDEAGQTALIDHELEHLRVAKNRDGIVKHDDCGRPKLKMTLHDHQLGVFDTIIRRHGLASIDARVVRDLFLPYRQLLMSWCDDQAPQDASPSIAGVIRKIV